MDAFDGPSDESSQATQMLMDLMPDKGSSVLSPAHPTKTIQTSVNLPVDPALDSFNSSRHSTLPTYHYHGLASTQTQTQPISDDPQGEGGSQKENFQNAQVATTSEAKPATLVPKAMSNRPSSSRGTPARTVNAEQSGHALAHSKTKVSNPRPVAIGALDSPRGRPLTSASKGKGASKKPPSRTLPSRQSKRKPSLGPSRDSSVDSFARELSQDPEERFVAENKQFEDPLSALGRDRLSADEPDVLSPSRSSMYAYSRSNRREPIVASHHGNVLVEATPSNSASSQSQPSQSHIQDTQIIDRPYEIPPTGSAQSDGYESSESFGRSLLVGGDTQPSPRQPVRTQEYVQTQPTGDVEMSESAGPSTGTPTRTPYATTGPSYGTTAGTGGSNVPRSNPRSLLGLYSRQNHWKYNKYSKEQEPLLPPISDNSPVRGVQPSAPSPWEETQPTTAEDYQPPPRRNLPMPRSTKGTQGTDAVAPISHMGDTMEIVPDSEPLQVLSPPRHQRVVDAGIDDQKNKPRPLKNTPLNKPAGRNVPAMVSDAETEDDEGEDNQPLAKPTTLAKQEEEDSDDDDIPLAAKSAKAGKGKGVAKRGRPPRSANPAAKPADIPQPKSTDKKKPGRKPTAKAKEAAPVVPKTRAGRSWETSVIPSSIPGEELAPLPKGKQAKTTRKVSNPRSTRSTVVNYQDPPTDDDEPEDDLRDLSPLTGGDQTTEPGDDEYMEVDIPEPGPSARKRKRAVSTQRVVVKQEKKKGTRHTSPPAKRLRSAAAGSSRTNNHATRVFALWKQDGHFYPGYVHSVDDTRYSIKFDDGTDALVTLEQMRLGNLCPGDDVLLAGRSLSYKVIKVDKLAEKLVTVKVDDTNKEVALGQLRIAHRTVTHAWSDRMLSKDAVVPLLKPNPVKLSPSPSKMSMMSIPPHKGNLKKKILARTGLVITLSVSNESRGRDRERVMAAVRNTGGTVVNDLMVLFCMDGEYDEGGGRWIINKDDVKWGGKGIERLFLLADDANQKPKYLMALALGIPCVSSSWLHHCVEAGEEKDWAAFMLPQGFSEVLGVRLSQQVDVDWGNSIHQLEDIMSNPVPNKLFRKATVLCVGHDMFPLRKGKKHPNNPGTSQDAINSLARIILCMGAESVEAVTTPDLASAPFNDYTYIVTRNLENEWTYLPRSRLVDWAWVKNCLLASRLLDMPYTEDDIIDSQLENSQEA